METSLPVAVVTVIVHVAVTMHVEVLATAPATVLATAPAPATVDTFAIVVNCLHSSQLFQLVQRLCCRHGSGSGSGSAVAALAALVAVAAVVVLDYDVMEPTVRDYLVQ